jgi:hypothetical protein
VLSVSIGRESLQQSSIFDVGTLKSVKHVKLQRIHLANIPHRFLFREKEKVFGEYVA